VLVVQVVEIVWTKATRGAPRASERAVLPRAFALLGGTDAVRIERYRMTEQDGFVPVLLRTERPPTAPRAVGVLQISIREHGRIVLGLSGTPHGGQPKRRPVPALVTLQPGQFARISVNARHTSYSGQYYSETVFNAACGDTIATDRFVVAGADREIDLKDNLF